MTVAEEFFKNHGSSFYWSHIQFLLQETYKFQKYPSASAHKDFLRIQYKTCIEKLHWCYYHYAYFNTLPNDLKKLELPELKPQSSCLEVTFKLNRKLVLQCYKACNNYTLYLHFITSWWMWMNDSLFKIKKCIALHNASQK